ncbi:MAG: DeoR/GlpR transcriptional regulator [Clostridiales bacterium]|nr:DeoR/GlpR transcriptional regulator [Clostridiales bacterium]
MKRTRIMELAEFIDKRGKLTLEQIQTAFPSVSLMTLRRDLLYLEQEGRLIRVRGGAISTKETQKTSGVPYTKKMVTHTDEKICIATKASKLMEEGVSVFLDAGSTALYFAKELPDIPCNIFTNGLAVATELSKKQNVSINLLGGPLIKENLSTASSLTSEYFKDANFEFAIIGASAFTPEIGFACGSQTEADLLKLICSRAKFTYVMLDSSKVGKIKPYTFARIEDVSVLITDDAFPEGLKELFRQKNIVVI